MALYPRMFLDLAVLEPMTALSWCRKKVWLCGLTFNSSTFG